MMRFIIIHFLIALSFFGFSQEIDMKTCIRYALEHNISLSNSEINTSVARENYQQSKRNILPIFETGVSGSQLFGRSIDPKTNSYVSEGSIFSSNAYLSAQVYLFNGFKQQNRIRYQKLQYLMSQENLIQMQMDIAFKVMNAYYDLVYYTNLEAIAEDQVSLTQLNLKKTNKLIDLGLKAESDLLEMQAQEAVEKHYKVSIKNQRESALFTLKKLMNYPVNKELNIKQDLLMVFANVDLSVDSIYKKAHAHMPVLKCSELNVKAGKKQLAIQRGNLSPSLSFGGTIASSFSDSWKEFIDPKNIYLGYKTVPLKNQLSNNVSKRLFVQLNIPIFSGCSKRSSIKVAKYDLMKAQNELLEVEQTLYQEIAEDHQKINALFEEQKLLQTKQKAMEQAYKVAEKKLEQGLINVMDFYAVKNQLANAEVELLRVELQRIIKKKTIDFYLGTVFYN